MKEIGKIYLSLYQDKFYSGLDLSEKQVEGLQLLNDDETKDLLFGGGAGGGKSWLGSTDLLFSCLAYPGIKTFIARRELKDITLSTLITFYKVANKYGVEAGIDFKYNGQYNFIYFENGSRIDLIQLAPEPKDPLYERLGSFEFTKGWIEEAGEIAQEAAEILSTRVGRHLNDKYHLLPKVLKTCNPTKNWLYTQYYQPYMRGSLQKGRVFLQSLVTDNPNIESNYIEQLENITNIAQKQRLLHGDWDFEDTSNQLVTVQWIESILTDEYPVGTNKRMAVDVAREGKDKIVASIWIEKTLVDLIHIKIDINDQTDISGLIKDRVKAIAIQNGIGYKDISIDAVGVGGGVVDAFRRDGWFVNSYKGGEKVEEKFTDNKFETYLNLRCYSYWQFRVLCQRREIHILRTLPFLEELVRELTAHTFATNEKVIIIEEKDKVKAKIGRSPDFSDSVVMGLAPKPKRSFGFAV